MAVLPEFVQRKAQEDFVENPPIKVTHNMMTDDRYLISSSITHSSSVFWIDISTILIKVGKKTIPPTSVTIHSPRQDKNYCVHFGKSFISLCVQIKTTFSQTDAKTPYWRVLSAQKFWTVIFTKTRKALRLEQFSWEIKHQRAIFRVERMLPRMYLLLLVKECQTVIKLKIESPWRWL